ncbi:MAG: biotin--[acetyl-CoA-carboxylase] ligase [Alphaproteobacteria bacterium]|nr:biotin--[acetyl-CoA-carboxylase] ligase [Alphaproteobacteria bacterium]MDP6564802.1 biotin--[acetyl-CoA-carboxylase] ligase [Alphaproteobacteria bacterium]MDP6814288.1 biotin--[acetyl-CoA-carboxylase] ligase [Alphaproteobacteria bacterium]
MPEFFRLHRFDQVESTNDEAKRLAGAGAPDGTLVVAGEQTAGRGRTGRQWKSPPGNLYMTLLLRPGVAAGVAAQVSFLAAVALSSAIADLAANLAPRHKWPNDVLLDGRKVSGILLESAAGADGLIDWLVLGMGVNVAHHPTDLEQSVTSLRREGLTELTPDALLGTLAPHLRDWLLRWRAEGFAPLRQAWLARAFGLGEVVGVRLPNENFMGRFLDLDADGALVVGLPDGTERRIAAGEVYFPAPRGGPEHAAGD